MRWRDEELSGSERRVGAVGSLLVFCDGVRWMEEAQIRTSRGVLVSCAREREESAANRRAIANSYLVVE